jgi:hypothetical protein
MSNAEAPFVATDKHGKPARVCPRWVVETSGRNRAARRRAAAIKAEVENLDRLLRAHAIHRWHTLTGEPRDVVLYEPGVAYVARRLGKPFHAVKAAALVCRDEIRKGL